MTTLEDIVSAKKNIIEIDNSNCVLPSNVRLLDFLTHGPNFELNELIIKKIYKYLQDTGLTNFYNNDKILDILTKFTNYDLEKLKKDYCMSNYSDVIEQLMFPPLYDIVFLIEDGSNMTLEYKNLCGMYIINIMLATELYDGNGVYIRTLNTDNQLDNSILGGDICKFIDKLETKNVSESLGEMMYDKVFECVIKPTVDDLDKPVFLIVLMNDIPINKDEVLESLERCKVESQHKMFISFVNITKSSQVENYHKELISNNNVKLTSSLHKIFT